MSLVMNVISRVGAGMQKTTEGEQNICYFLRIFLEYKWSLIKIEFFSIIIAILYCYCIIMLLLLYCYVIQCCLYLLLQTAIKLKFFIPFYFKV